MYQFYNRCTSCGKVMSKGGKTLCYNCQRIAYQKGLIERGETLWTRLKNNATALLERIR